jgi:hypothetical protein
MPHPAAIPTPSAGRSFAFVATLLAALGGVLVIAAAWGIVHGLRLPDQLPPHPEVVSAPVPPAKIDLPERPDSKNTIAGAANQEAYIASLRPAPAPTAPPSQPIPGYRPGALQHPEILELVEVAVALKKDGDTAGALKKLRDANARLPDQPRILWELAELYSAMSLSDKADTELVKLCELGAAVGGEYFELANLKLGIGATPGTHYSPDFSFGKTLVSRPAGNDGERVIVRLSIHSLLEGKATPSDISLVMEFYDLVDNAHIEETRSNAPVSRWPTAPVDWGDAGTEIVEWEYHMPGLDPQELESFGKRQYYGYVARLYYKDQLQDVLAEPRTLLARPAQVGGAALLDDSLFPNPN